MTTDAPRNARRWGGAAARTAGAAVMPSVCFIVGNHILGLAGAVVAAVAWGVTYQLLLHRIRRHWSVLVTLNLSELLVRSALALWLGSATVFFVMPSVVTACFGAVYVGSTIAGRPLLAAIGREVLPTGFLDTGSPRRAALLWWGSIGYGIEQITVAGLSIALALSVPPDEYMAVHPPVSWSTLGLGIGAFALVCRRRAARHPRRGRPATRGPAGRVASIPLA